MDLKNKTLLKQVKDLIAIEKYEEALTLCTDDLCLKEEKFMAIKIHLFFKLSKYSDIISLCDQAYLLWPKEHFLKSKYTAISFIVKEAIKKGEYERALNYLSSEICCQDPVLLGQKITVFKKLKQYDEALALCPPLTKNSNNVIEEKKISILFLLEKYDEIIKECSLAMSIWKNSLFSTKKNVAVKHLVKKMIKQKNYQEALSLFKKEFILENEEDKEILKNLLKPLEYNKKYSEEVEFFTDELCSKDENFCRKKIYLLFILERYEEAVEVASKAYMIWKNEDFMQSRETAISHVMKKLETEENLEGALEYYQKHFVKPVLVLETQRVSILFRLKRYLEVVEVCTDHLKIWQNNSFFINRQEEALKLLACHSFNVNHYLTRIYFDDISCKELESLEVEAFEKIILQIAYYDKHGSSHNNRRQGLQLIKECLSSISFTEEQKSIVANLKKKFIQKISSKKAQLVDWNYYCSILNCSIDKDYELKEKSSLRRLEMKK